MTALEGAPLRGAKTPSGSGTTADPCSGSAPKTRFLNQARRRRHRRERYCARPRATIPSSSKGSVAPPAPTTAMARAAGPRLPGGGHWPVGWARWHPTSPAVTAAATDGTGGTILLRSGTYAETAPVCSHARVHPGAGVPDAHVPGAGADHLRPAPQTSVAPAAPTYAFGGTRNCLAKSYTQDGSVMFVDNCARTAMAAGRLAAGADCSGAVPLAGSSHRMARHARHPDHPTRRRTVGSVLPVVFGSGRPHALRDRARSPSADWLPTTLPRRNLSGRRSPRRSSEAAWARSGARPAQAQVAWPRGCGRQDDVGAVDGGDFSRTVRGCCRGRHGSATALNGFVDWRGGAPYRRHPSLPPLAAPCSRPLAPRGCVLGPQGRLIAALASAFRRLHGTGLLARRNGSSGAAPSSLSAVSIACGGDVDRRQHLAIIRVASSNCRVIV